jgi:hypothetical protein
VNPPGIILQLPQPEEVLEPFLRRFHRAVHHRGGRAQAGGVGFAHDAQPFVGRGFVVAIQDPAHAVHQDLGAAARDAVETRRDQTIDHGADRQLRKS